MSTKKTIQINPDLFSMSPKKRGRQSTPNIKTPKKQPPIRPNSLKKKLIQRVKEHKLKETREQEISKRVAQEIMTPDKENKYMEEFNDSISYLNQLSNQNKHLLKQKRKSFTLKNSAASDVPPPNLILDTPLEISSIPPIPQIPENELPIKLNTPQQSQQSVPYGCLKGGTKPTYKSWMKTQKNSDSYTQQPELSLPLDLPDSFQQIPNEREKKLNDLKEKVRQKHEKELSEQQFFNKNSVITTQDSNNYDPALPLPIPVSLPESDIPKKIKKTTKRTYNLGKSRKKKSIGVLIKDRKTRKKIIDAQKELKRKNITDVKQYLRDHGLIKAGSKAPNDIMRKIYESSMLSGDVTNQDNEILMHNFLNEND